MESEIKKQGLAPIEHIELVIRDINNMLHSVDSYEEWYRDKSEKFAICYQLHVFVNPLILSQNEPSPSNKNTMAFHGLQ